MENYIIKLILNNIPLKLNRILFIQYFVFNYLKILDLYPLLEKFVIISLFKWGIV